MSDPLYTLYSIGYTGRTPEEIVAAARTLNATIVDIRLHARSRVEHWNGYALRRILESAGQRYHQIPALGNANYHTPNLPIEIKDPEMGCIELKALLKKSPCVMLCACKNADECHRSTVAALMTQSHDITWQEIQRKDETHHDQLDQLTLF